MKRALTWRERFEAEYAVHFIPYLRILEKEIGREKVIDSLKELALHAAEEGAKAFIKARGKNDLSLFKYYSPTTAGIKDVLTIEVVEDTDKAYGIKITECLWAKVFREADASDYGYATVCFGDVPFARFVNPQIDLDLKGTIMEGKSLCALRYYVKA